MGEAFLSGVFLNRRLEPIARKTRREKGQPLSKRYLDEVVEENESGLHDPRVLVAKGTPEVGLEVGDGVWGEEEKSVHRHDRLLPD